MNFIENTSANIWNRMVGSRSRRLTGGLNVGFLVMDGRPTEKHFFIPQSKRPEHLVIVGKTGSGKTYLLFQMCLQDIRAGRGFVFFDHHGDTIPLLLAAIAAEEQRTGQDLSSSVVVIEPGDTERSVGLNVLDRGEGRNIFVEVVGIASILKERWGLDHFGAPTEEVLRNSLHTLSENNLTLVELGPLLTNASFRAQCLKRVTNSEVREYWEQRFEPSTEGMKAVRRDPVLNKVSEFVSDPHFRHILGQQHSTFSFSDVLDGNKWVLVNLAKGRLGRHSSTLGSLVLSQIKPAIFRRRSRQLFTLYLDEIQNLLVADSDIDVLLAEARKFGVSVVTANQFADQFPIEMRSAIQAVGTHIYFQLSSSDAQHAAVALDGGKPVAEQLKNLPKRNCIAKSGHYPWRQVEVPRLELPRADYDDLLNRSRELYARRREEIEREIRARRPQLAATNQEAFDEWE